MKKIILAFDGTHFSNGAFEFAKHLNEKNKILLTGAFLPQVNYANLWSYADSMSSPIFIPLVEGEETIAVAKNIEKFESLCKRNDIEYRVHKDFSDFALPGLKKETRFADLLILGSESFYENLGTNEPNEYLKDALKNVECPVIVVPEDFIIPKQNIIAYDGSEMSVYSIKQFAYLLPEFTTNKTILAYANEVDEQIPDQLYVEELAARHFPDLTITKLDFSAKKYFNTWMGDKKNTLLISGSFGKSGIKSLFHKSFITETIKEHKTPIFIAHH